MTLRSPLVALSLMLAARPAMAQQAAAPPPPLLAPQSNEPPAPEIRLGGLQVWLGLVGTTVVGIGLVLGSAEANSRPLGYASVAALPGAGSFMICGLGRTSPDYEGGCGATVLGGYLGAVLLALPMAYLGAAEFSPKAVDKDGSDTSVGAGYGAVLGFVVGTVVGATVAWHLSKRPRVRAPELTLGAPPPPPAALAAWSELRARPIAARAPAAIGLPLLSLRF